MQAEHGGAGSEQRLLALLDAWRNRSEAEQGYGPGNVINLLRLARGDLRGLNLSNLAIRQAYLAIVDAQEATVKGAHLADSGLAEAFDFPDSVALSADATVLAVGTSTGQICLWRVADRTLVASLEGHSGAVWGVALSADGKLLASSGAAFETAAGAPRAISAAHHASPRPESPRAMPRRFGGMRVGGCVHERECRAGSLATTKGTSCSAVVLIVISAPIDRDCRADRAESLPRGPLPGITSADADVRNAPLAAEGNP